MQLYNCKVRLHGSLLNEVRKEDVTASEIFVFRALHGDDAVVEIEHTGRQAKGRTDMAERERLNHEYGAGLSTIDHVKSLNGIFGAMGSLPQAMPGVAHLKAGAAPKKVKEPVPMADETIDLATDDDLTIPELEEA